MPLTLLSPDLNMNMLKETYTLVLKTPQESLKMTPSHLTQLIQLWQLNRSYSDFFLLQN